MLIDATFQILDVNLKGNTMFTSLDKALVALVMGVLYLLNTFTTFHVGLTQDQVTAAIALLTPVLVYLVPNKASA